MKQVFNGDSSETLRAIASSEYTEHRACSDQEKDGWIVIHVGENELSSMMLCLFFERAF